MDHRFGTGIPKRGFGPDFARPIIREFDGERVPLMNDGIRTETLYAQSRHHGQDMHFAQLARLEIVGGTGMLFYSAAPLWVGWPMRSAGTTSASSGCIPRCGRLSILTHCP